MRYCFSCRFHCRAGDSVGTWPKTEWRGQKFITCSVSAEKLESIKTEGGVNEYLPSVALNIFDSSCTWGRIHKCISQAGWSFPGKMNSTDTSQMTWTEIPQNGARGCTGFGTDLRVRWKVPRRHTVLANLNEANILHASDNVVVVSHHAACLTRDLLIRNILRILEGEREIEESPGRESKERRGKWLTWDTSSCKGGKNRGE